MSVCFSDPSLSHFCLAADADLAWAQVVTPSSRCALGAREPAAPVLKVLRNQDHLANILTGFYIAVCRSNFGKRKSLVHMGTNPTLINPCHQLLHPNTHFFRLMP